MRRGHPGIGGWRNENARHFRPRGGTSHFRSSRGYALLEEPRFPPPGPRLHRGSQCYTHPGRLDELGTTNHHGRNPYRGRQRNIQTVQQREPHNQDRQALSYHHSMRHKDNSNHGSSYVKSNFYEDVNLKCHINNMGDIDHRAQNIPFNQHQISPWINSPFENNRPYDDHRSSLKSRHHDIDERNKVPVEYTGHRPPSSDHYVGTPGPPNNNNNTAFSRSVDDTVDLVRKRLMNRNESQPLLEVPPIEHSNRDQDDRINIYDNYQNIQQEPPVKKKIQRQRQNVKSNCDKIKNKIVHQLFKMDKDKIQKLMDNPNSSIKFEYAISSLITESQNSFNKHLRSVAEKSLYSSSTDFIQNDNNTIYEDTFMKQMQCILDPQDTVLLEDIKPLVMAELSKVLQLSDFDHRFEVTDDQGIYHMRDDQSNYHDFGEVYNNEDYLQDTYSEQDQSARPNHENFENIGLIDERDRNYEYNPQAHYEDPKVLLERRLSKKSCDYSDERRRSSESRQSRRSLDNKSNEDKFKSSEKQLPLFDTNTEQLSEEEDPFADLDNQYHVAVDHNFIETDDIVSPPQSIACNSNTSPTFNKNTRIIEAHFSDSPNIKKEIDNQLLSIAKSPLKLFSSISSKDETQQKPQNADDQVEKDVSQDMDCAKENMSSRMKNNSMSESKVVDNNNLNQEQIPKNEETDKAIAKSENCNNVKSFSPTNPRKRSIDQRPSHRKEKRKKSECSPSDTVKNTQNKNTVINVDCAEKSHDAAKSIFNLFYSKDNENKEISKEGKKIESTDKGYSAKYVKRKEPQNKTKEKESNLPKKRNSTSSSHSILSPKESNNSIVSNQALPKPDAKTKLKTIDIFSEQPRKLGSMHQSHRNTATAPIVTIKTEKDENKLKNPTMNPRKLTYKHVGTQVIKRFHSRETQTFETKRCNSKFCQTERIKSIAQSTQTDDFTSLETLKLASNDAFERMKEIDLEIQILLQEKFKLYNSLESKHARNKSTMETLGMTVLNVTPVDEIEQNDSNDNDSEDAIVDNFTNIPAEELEQIAFETVQEQKTDQLKKINIPEKILHQERKSSESPTNLKRSNRKAKTPNISLLEQIITDERPLEEIISLDDLESTPVKSKKKPLRLKSKKKLRKKTKMLKSVSNAETYDLKECSVLLTRGDIRKYLKPVSAEPIIEEMLSPTAVVPTAEKSIEDKYIEEKLIQEKQVDEPSSTVDESVVNELQFDMLDVSEDIVIGDSCDVKLSGDKDVNERMDVPINEEIILDNSQSSLEDTYLSDVVQGEIECKMYDYSTDENLRRDSVTVTGNADAVLAIECIENNFIAACLDGNVYHFSGDGQLLNTLRGSNLAVTCLTIVQEKYGTTVYTGSLDSRIRYYDLETGLEKGPECNVLSPIQTMDRAWDTVFVGTRTGFVLQFECKNNMLIPVSTVKFSEQSILALRAMKEGPRKVLLVAARSENVTIKDAQTGLLLRTLNGPKMTVYTLLFEDGKVYCGTSSHQIHVFEYSSGSHVGAHEGGKGAVCLRASGGLLFAGCYDGCVYVYREGETRPLAQLRGPGLMLLSLAIVGSKIIAGYKDRSLYIWKIPLTILQEMIL